ncbi:MAG: cytochrome C [Sedimenticola sp.]|nr:MAG: cytochrome C [Sedimenticola sp.]
MKEIRSYGLHHLGLLAGILVAFYTAGVHSDPIAEPLALHGIMEQMGERMQAITDGISRQEWQQVEQSAREIAEHPQPPFGEKLRILSFAGSRVTDFKQYDGETRQVAKELALLAGEQNGSAVIIAFSTLQTSCLVCHQKFRGDFQRHFYGQQSKRQ